MKTLAIGVATLGLAFTATPAFAQTADVRVQEISVAGIDLSTAEGQRMLDERVERAAREVCGYDEARVGTLIRSAEARDCVAKAQASAREQVATIAQEQLGG